MTLPEHSLRVAGFCQMTHPNFWVWGMILKCPQITFGAKNPCGTTFPEHFMRVAGFSQMTHSNSVNSTVPSSKKRVHGQTSNLDQNILSIPNFWNQALHIPTLLLNIIQCDLVIVYCIVKLKQMKQIQILFGFKKNYSNLFELGLILAKTFDFILA